MVAVQVFMIRSISFTFVLLLPLVSACKFGSTQHVQNTVPSPVPSISATPTPVGSAETGVEEAAGKSAVLRCLETKTGNLKIDKKQTFAVDFEPFRGSCFVTTYDPEYGDDPPLESSFAIYKNEKKAFDFPSQFNGVTSGCWVEAVAFQDLNEDKLTDIIVVGKCSAKSAPYNENMVYVNTGKTFTTREDANFQLTDKTTIKAIADFVKENRTMFFNN